VLLAEHFLEVGNRTYNKNIQGFSDSVINSLKYYTFPGNVRELENIILNAVAKTFGESHISSIDLPKEYIKPFEPGNGNGNGKPKLTSLNSAAEEHIMSVMKTVGNSVQRAAPLLGVSERTLQRRLKAIRERRN
jgi:transcriptional regulator with PAS, ATPase and Fis domain